MHNNISIQTLIDSIEDIVAIMYPDLTIERYNQEGYNFLGLEPEQVIGRKCYEIMNRETSCDNCSSLRAFKTGKKEVSEKYLPEKDIYLKCSSTPVYDDNNNIIRIIEHLKDITSTRELEIEKNKFKELKDKLENLADQAPGMTYQYRLYPDGSTCFPYSSEGIYDIYGVTAEEVKEDDSKAYARIHPEDYDDVVESIRMSAKNLTIWKEEYRTILPEEGLKWVAGTAKPERLSDGSTLWHGNIHDITERKNKELEIKKQKDKLDLIIDSTKVGTWEFNIQTGETNYNKQWAKMIGYTLKELNPKKKEVWDSLVHPEDIKKSDKLFQKHLNGEIDLYSCEKRVKHKDGHWVWILGQGKLVSRTADGRPLKVLGVNIDISDQKEHEKIIKELNKVAIEFQKINDEQEIYDRTIEKAKKILNFNFSGIALAKDDRFIPAATTGNIEKTSFPIDRGIIGKAFKENQSYLTSDIEKDPYAKPVNKAYKSGIAIPINNIGVFLAISNKKSAFDQQDLELAEILISQTKAALERIKSQKKLKEKNLLFESTLESIQDGITVLNPDFSIRYTNSAMEKWYSDKAPLTGKKCFQAYHDNEDICSECPSEKSAKTGNVEKIIINGPEDSNVEYLEIFSYPMFENDEFHGVVEFIRDITERKRSENKLIQTKERLDAEINKAKALHQKTLPTNIPDIKNLDIYAHYNPANEIGGDFYNFIKLDDDKLLFYLTDITGHGLDASIMSNFVKTIINTYIELLPDNQLPDPKKIIKFIFKQNEKENFPEEYFITLLLGTIDLANDKLIYSSAGMHIPPVICNNGIRELPAGNLPISKVFPFYPDEYKNIEVNLEEKSTLFISTDGLFEQTDGEEKYGDRYKEIICQNNYLPPGAISEEINEDFLDFTKDKTKDDITYAIFKYKPGENVELNFEINSTKKDLDLAKSKLEYFLLEKVDKLDIDLIIIAFHEMLINALEHGNKFNENKKIKIKVILEEKYIEISVKDSGPGFNWKKIREEKSGTIHDLQDEVEIQGRGLGLMMAKKASDFLYYNYEGNQVTFIKKFSRDN